MLQCGEVELIAENGSIEEKRHGHECAEAGTSLRNRHHRVGPELPEYVLSDDQIAAIDARKEQSADKGENAKEEKGMRVEEKRHGHECAEAGTSLRNRHHRVGPELPEYVLSDDQIAAIDARKEQSADKGENAKEEKGMR
eukprot:c40250_g1_i1 orf=396-815(+)